MKKILLYETAKKSGSRIKLTELSQRTSTTQNPMCILSFDETKEFQTIQGFGGALTESSAYVLTKLSNEKKHDILEAFFGKNGNNYSVARSHINSCDFSLGNWTCLDNKDESLESFSMERAEKYVVPLIEDCFAIVKNASNKELLLMLSPWSPPAWMKTNGNMNHGGKLLPQYKELYAQLMLRYIEELEKKGLPTWALSVQNEPAAVQTWDSCIWSAEEEAEFACEYLGPILEKTGKGHIKIFVWDHNRDLLFERFSKSMEHKNAQKYIAGAAYHWYSGDQYENVKAVYDNYPDKTLIFTEGCIEGGPRNGAWFSGERYAHNIINDLLNGCTTWIDWNIVLNTQGGPNHVGNYCDAPVLIDETTKDVFYQSSYYYQGHFSRFIQPMAKRIESTLWTGMIPASPDGQAGNLIEGLAVKNPDGNKVIILCNRTEASVSYKLKNAQTGTESDILFIPSRGIHTLKIEKLCTLCK